MNAWDMVLGTLVAAAVAYAVWSLVRRRRAGGCASCPFAEGCGQVGRPCGSGREVRHG